MRSPTSHFPPYDLNSGYLSMGFAEANPRQLTLTVGETQVGITISAAPSPAVDDLAISSTSEGPDPTWVHRNLGFINIFIKIYIKHTEKTRKFSSASLEDQPQQKRSRAA